MLSQKHTDMIKLITAFLTATFLFLGTLGYSFEKFNPTTIEAFGIFLGAAIPLGVTFYGIWTNTFTRLEAFQKAQEKEAQRLIEEGMIANPNKPIEVKAPAGAEDGSDVK